MGNIFEKMTGETPEVRSDKRETRETREKREKRERKMSLRCTQDVIGRNAQNYRYIGRNAQNLKKLPPQTSSSTLSL